MRPESHAVATEGVELDAWRERILRVTLIVTLVASAIPLLSMLLQALYPPHDWPAFWRVLPVYVFVALLPQGKGAQARGTRVTVRFPR